ncbi:MAG: YigZ family protein [Peptoniphilaceae bacterium]
MYRSFLKNGQDEFVEKKSKFIGYGFKVYSEEEALKRIEEIKKRHKDANHNCSAYIIGEDKLIQRYSDDGEPSGTAGIPILEVLKKEDLTNVLVIVTRYFGGILLGAGGLVRAYSKGSKMVIDASIPVEIQDFEKIKISYDYTFHGAINNYLIKNNYKILNEKFTDDVSIEVHKSVNDFNLIKELKDLTSANIKIKLLRLEQLPVRDGNIIYGGM